MWVKPQGDNVGKVTLCFSLPSKKEEQKEEGAGGWGEAQREGKKEKKTHTLEYP